MALIAVDGGSASPSCCIQINQQSALLSVSDIVIRVFDCLHSIFALDRVWSFLPAIAPHLCVHVRHDVLHRLSLKQVYAGALQPFNRAAPLLIFATDAACFLGRFIQLFHRLRGYERLLLRFLLRVLKYSDQLGRLGHHHVDRAFRQHRQPLFLHGNGVTPCRVFRGVELAHMTQGQSLRNIDNLDTRRIHHLLHRVSRVLGSLADHFLLHDRL